MEVELTVTQSEYHAILIWDDDGGATRNVIYRIIPDTIYNASIKPPESCNPNRRMKSTQVSSRSPTPFELELSRYAASRARALYFGDPPPFSSSSFLRSATVSLLRFGELSVGVTCQHVLHRYREVKTNNPNTIFQIGSIQFDPVECLISEDSELDLVTLDLSQIAGSANGLPQSSFIEPKTWPPEKVCENDILCLAGFPGIWRDKVARNELRFHSFSSGATFVRDANDTRFIVQIHSDEEIVTINKGLTLGSLGGLSGGPVFCWRTDGILRAELVGFVFQYAEQMDLMFVRSARVLNQDGTLNRI